MTKTILCLLLVAFGVSGCSLVGCDRVFPHFTWYWSDEAKRCRKTHQQEHMENLEYQRTNHVHTISTEPWVQESAWDNHWDLIYQDPKVTWRQYWVKLNATNRLDATIEAKQWLADNP